MSKPAMPRSTRSAAPGLAGLGTRPVERTSVEPGDPVGIDHRSATRSSSFPLIYWPVLPDAQSPSAGRSRQTQHLYQEWRHDLLRYARGRRRSQQPVAGEASGATLALRRIVEKLDIPPLEPVPPDHVLTKAFYLLQSFPGRYERGQLWVETAEGGPPVPAMPMA